MNLIAKVKELNLPLGSYAVFGSGPMVARGLREPHDIDIVVTTEIYEKFRSLGWHEEIAKSGAKAIYHDIYEMHTGWDFRFVSDYNPDPKKLIEEAEIIDGVAFVKLEEVKNWKTAFGREKDLADIRLIDEYLAEQ